MEPVLFGKTSQLQENSFIKVKKEKQFEYFKFLYRQCKSNWRHFLNISPFLIDFTAASRACLDTGPSPF